MPLEKVKEVSQGEMTLLLSPLISNSSVFSVAFI